MVTAATVRQDTFTAIRALIIANKPTYTHNSVTYTYTVVAEYPEDDAVFPCIVINKANVKSPTITMDATTSDYDIEVQLDFYAKGEHGKKAIDAAQDSLQNTFTNNIPTFIDTNGLIPQEDFWFDVDSPPFLDMNQIVNTGNAIVKFRLK